MRILLSILVSSASLAAGQEIVVTGYPPLGTYGSITGYVTNSANPTEYKLAIVDDVFGSFWSKPTAAQPFVWINGNGTFTAYFITGGQDACAQKIYLFLVPANATVPLTLGGGGIPGELPAMSIASTVVDRIPALARITWSGFNWIRKDTGECIWGPGPNYFSKDGVTVDAEDKLHLSVFYTNGQWRCAEIISEDTFGYGLYSFQIESVPADLPDPIVAGFFTFEDGASPANREIDVEFSNGPVVGKDAPWQYVLQPYNLSGHRHRFSLGTNIVPAVQTFFWLPGVIQFASYESVPTFGTEIEATYKFLRNQVLTLWWPPDGLFLDEVTLNVPGTRTINVDTPWHWVLSSYWCATLKNIVRPVTPAPYESWNVDSANIPPHGNEKIHINAWLHDRLPPGDPTNRYEIVVKAFTFQPFDAKQLIPRLNVSNLISDRDFGTKFDMRVTVPAQ